MPAARAGAEKPGSDSAITQARAAGLRYVSDAEPGIRRVRAGKGFRYLRPDGKPLGDRSRLEAIRKLAVPPAYERVWICADRRGHLQATGYDERGRKQYRYHPEWRRIRDAAKFERMIEFGASLPRIRAHARRRIAEPGLARDKVAALMVLLLDRTMARIGNESYRRQNGTYGLTTLLNRHARFLGGNRLRLRFSGKHGIASDLLVDDARLIRLVRRCQQLPGQALFQYRDEDGAPRAIDSGQVNDYLCEVTGEAFTAKDFRCWHATVEACRWLARTPLPDSDSERARARCIHTAVAEVAKALGNTAAVCRASYINPAVFDAWADGSLQRLAKRENMRTTRSCERVTLKLLARAGRLRPKRS